MRPGAFGQKVVYLGYGKNCDVGLKLCIIRLTDKPKQ